MSENIRNVLVTGGAGYIGSHTAKALANGGFIPITYDSLVRGHRWAVKWGPFVEGDIGDKAKLLQTIRQYEIGAVIHFAAFAYVGESVTRPELYFENNVTKSLALLGAVAEARVRHVVFSSSCATYGIPERSPITEETPQLPVNPYGETKLIIERALHWYGNAHDISWAALRYFNAAGADFECEVGEAHSPETHLIPLVLDSAAYGKTVEIYGDDYPTSDGTCVRDYIHVTDLAEAHVRALHYLMKGGTSIALNLGTGNGYSIRQVIGTVEQVTGRKVLYRVAGRRAGGPAGRVADPSLAGKVLAWHLRFSDLESIVSSARRWHSKEPSARNFPPPEAH
jgi:UDP-arabinose 4-epimerase